MFRSVAAPGPAKWALRFLRDIADVRVRAMTQGTASGCSASARSTMAGSLIGDVNVLMVPTIRTRPGRHAVDADHGRSIGQRIREVRSWRGMSLRAVAELPGVTESYLSLGRVVAHRRRLASSGD